MAKKTILIIADEHKTITSLKEMLGHRFHLEVVKGSKTAAAALDTKLPDLIIIDFDLKDEDGLEVFSSLGATIKVIMLSASGNIPLAVSATKQGVAEFLSKPLEAGQLLKAVEANIAREDLRLRLTAGTEWLVGESTAQKKMISQIQDALRSNKDIVLIGERGIPKDRVAEFIHGNGPKAGGSLVRVDLAAFRQENLETHFWASVQEIMSLPQANTIQDEADRCGTIYIANIDALDEIFKLSVVNFLASRPAKIDQTIRAIIGVYDSSEAQKFTNKDLVEIEIPPLRERKGDLPYLLEFYLKLYSNKYGKNVKFISAELFDFLILYAYPGNYVELAKMIEASVLTASSDKLEFENFPFNYEGLAGVSLKKGIRTNLTLQEATRSFEKDLYYILLQKAGGDSSKVARLLAVPKTVLAERIENLLD